MPSASDRIFYKTDPSQPSFDVAVPQGQPRIETPLQEADPTHHIITQNYMTRGGSYVRPAENERCPQEIAGRLVAFFCEDSPREPVGGGELVTFNRTWATKPANVVDYDTLVVTLPSQGGVYRFDIGSAGSPFNFYPYLAVKAPSRPLLATITRTFFLIGTDNANAGINCDYSAVTSIPALNETIYTGRDVTAGGAGPLTDAQMTSLPAQNVGYFSGAILEPAWTTTGTGDAVYVASPLAAGTYYLGNSRPRRYLGNIWERISTQITI